MKTAPLPPLAASLTPGPQAPSPSTANGRTRPLAAPPAPLANAAPAPGASQGVHLGGHVPQLQRSLGGSADFDAQKVESVRRAIANGSFRVNAHAVADKLLRNAEELLAPAARPTDAP